MRILHNRSSSPHDIGTKITPSNQRISLKHLERPSTFLKQSLNQTGSLNPTVEAIINRNSKYSGKMREEGHENHRYKVTKKRNQNYVLPTSSSSYVYPNFSSKTLHVSGDTSLPYIHKSKFGKFSSNRDSRTADKGPSSFCKSGSSSLK